MIKLTRWALAAMLGLALAACAPNEPTSSTSPAPQQEQAAQQPIEGEGSKQAVGEHGMPYDAEWLDMMVHHHLGAVEMAREATGKAQRDEVKDLASKIVEDQEAEIARLEEWRKSWYPDVAALDMDQMAHHMSAMEVPEGEEPYDERFLAAMIQHHEDALEMATEAGDKAEHDELKRLAAEIVRKQQGEIDLMRQWQTSASR